MYPKVDNFPDPLCQKGDRITSVTQSTSQCSDLDTYDPFSIAVKDKSLW